VVAVACAACGPKPVAVGVTADDAIIAIRSNVRDAQVYVDGKFVTPLDAAGGGLAVEPGTHRFELRRDGYFSSYLELTLARAERRKVSMELAPILP
jgi:PEGA domain